jgi:hypothetical protein
MHLFLIVLANPSVVLAGKRCRRNKAVMPFLSCVAQTDSPSTLTAVPDTQSTAADTHVHEALVLSKAISLTFVAVLTEHPISPRGPADAKRGKKGCETKRTRNAFLIRYELVKHCTKKGQSYPKTWRRASTLVSPFRLVRVGHAKHGHRNTRKRRRDVAETAMGGGEH